MKMENVSMVKSFLEGNENILFNAKTSDVFSKIHLGDDMFALYEGHIYTSPDELINKYDSKIVFIFFPKKKCVLFVPHSEIYHIQQFFGGYTVCKNKEDVAEFLGYSSFNQKELVEQIQNKYWDEQKTSLLAKYPDIDSFPEDVKASAIESRKHFLKDYYGTEETFSSDEREKALRGEERSFSFEIPKVDAFKLATTAILKNEREAINLLVAEETEDDKQKRISSLASYYLHLQGVKKAEENLSENDKKKRACYNAIQKVTAEKFTVIYDAKKVLEGLKDSREKFENDSSSMSYSRKETWKQIFNYLDSHDKLIFKADKDRGFSVTREFIEPYYTDMSNKPVFGLDRYEYIPTEMEKVLDNLDNLIDIRYRNKSIL